MDPLTFFLVLVLLLILFGGPGFHIVSGAAIGLWDLLLLALFVAVLVWLVQSIRRPRP